ncbi:helix-turn-helix domain-containing protein [Neisseria leonii]|uniref:Helix-turn-helix domain-containing protein n=1 Tax=Neisseria leonii TaxID=2995413 RepID=A0A9X4E2U8_9NEIS|nr:MULTISPECIES: helix-turn-helix domain-containing protein [unclassified Neisseria]MDD9324732.1 helix-turn-helix domain-containing protein [Neisseria sp. 3986]MDD9327705.1 helix-turn-helix domain-containing protein [Neisseria sp. 51.81]
MIGNRIKLARKTAKRSQQWLADEIGVHQTSVTQWETGKTDPTTENLSRIAQVLDVSFEWLAKGTGEMGVVYQPVTIKLAEPLPQYKSYSEEQLEFLRLFDALPKSKREILLTFMRDWIG